MKSLISFNASVSKSKSIERSYSFHRKRFKNRIHLKQKNGLLDWVPAIEKIKNGGFKIVAVKAQHGQGKSSRLHEANV